MNWKKNIKKFFTIARNGSGGFTLVELIVVIAILAILAGVAVPSYNGYIKKARESADYQIIAAVNTAFASACLENNIPVTSVASSSISLIDKKVYSLTNIDDATGKDLGIDSVSLAFERFYVGNEDATFVSEGINSLSWDSAESSFILSKDSVPTRMTLANGNSIVVTPEQIQALADSGLIALGYSGMKSIMDGVYGSSETLVSLLGNSDEYFSRLSDAIVKNGLMTTEEAAEISKALRGQSSTYTKEEAKKRAANALTLCAAIEIADPKTDVDKLMAVDFGSNTLGIMSAYTSGIGGSAATAALAMQYAVTSNYAQQHPDDIVSVGVDVPFFGRVSVDMTMEEFLNGTYSGKNSTLANATAKTLREDPAAYMDIVSTSSGYQSYVSDSSEDSQYKKDIAGMNTALGILGSNVSKDNVDGVINVTGQGGYLDEGINSEDTKNLIDTVINTAKQSQGN